jgi:hypothetical protein
MSWKSASRKRETRHLTPQTRRRRIALIPSTRRRFSQQAKLVARAMKSTKLDQGALSSLGVTWADISVSADLKERALLLVDRFAHELNVLGAKFENAHPPLPTLRRRIRSEAGSKRNCFILYGQRHLVHIQVRMLQKKRQQGCALGFLVAKSFSPSRARTSISRRMTRDGQSNCFRVTENGSPQSTSLGVCLISSTSAGTSGSSTTNATMTLNAPTVLTASSTCPSSDGH